MRASILLKQQRFIVGKVIAYSDRDGCKLLHEQRRRRLGSLGRGSETREEMEDWPQDKEAQKALNCSRRDARPLLAACSRCLQRPAHMPQLHGARALLSGAPAWTADLAEREQRHGRTIDERISSALFRATKYSRKSRLIPLLKHAICVIFLCVFIFGCVLFVPCIATNFIWKVRLQRHLNMDCLTFFW